MVNMYKPTPWPRLLLAGMLISLIAPACYKDKFSDIDVPYHGTLAVPVGQVGFSLSELLEVDSLFSVDAQDGIGVIYREDEFFTLSAAELLNDFTDDVQGNFEKEFAIGTLEVDDFGENFEIVFGELVNDFEDPMAQNFLQQNDSELQIVPAFSTSVQTEIVVPTFSDFTYMQIENGKLELSVHNSLFVDLEDFSASLIDNTSGQTVGVLDFAYIAKNSTETRELNLQGKTVGNNLSVVLHEINSPGSGGLPVLIDLDALLNYEIKVKDIKVSAGQVMLEPGTIGQDKLQYEIDMENGERIYGLRLSAANVHYTVNSDVQAPLKMKLTFPNVFKNGQAISREITIGPGNANTGTLDFSNTIWKLDQDNAQPFNRFDVDYEISVPGPGSTQVQFSKDDKVSLVFSLQDVEMEEASGFFGFREELLEENTIDLGFDLDIFGSESSPIYFDNPVMRVEVVNSFGVPLHANFNVDALGKNGGSVALNPPKVVIKYPEMGEMGQVKKTVFVVDKSNSNIVNLLAAYPEMLVFNGAAIINPENNSQEVNFVTADSKLSASLEFDLPFKFRVENLVYRDTGEALDLNLEDGLTVNDIEKADLKILYKNGLPLTTSARIIALGADGSETVVVENATIEPATMDANGKVNPDGIAKGEIFVSLNSEQISQLDNATKNIYEVRFQTLGNGQTPVNMYTDYQIDLNVGLSLTFDKQP